MGDGGVDDEAQPDAEWWPLKPYPGLLRDVAAFHVADLGWRLSVANFSNRDGPYTIFSNEDEAGDTPWRDLPIEVRRVDFSVSSSVGEICDLATLRMTMMEMVRVGRELRDRELPPR